MIIENGKYYTNSCAGYSFIELLLAIVVGSIVLASSYVSYAIIAKQFERVSAYSEVQSGGMPTLNIVSRDIRMAGNKAIDNNLKSTYGAIASPITITDSGNSCCDSVAIIYDKSTTERLQVSYYTAPRTNPTRTALYRDTRSWNGASWNDVAIASLVTDYVEDFQLLGSQIGTSGFPQIIDLSIILRNRTPLKKLYPYTKPTYSSGNYNFSTTDMFHRDEFNATIKLRNIR